MNCKQDHSANDIIHIFIKYIYIYKINLKKKKKTCNEQHKYIK